ncbi:hypothetical protein FH972_000242 [Carpinus fangiana]|uniref:F-box/LRR-repeat protein 15/At3g58940/PEG3-like LRR domain-containing protein n=1 Tax=Carpinus fangiana TaxID=176857 RepID=A0A5N6QB94_9ROSI|nr:hypothetical protein FH972_000242 [Carpinus fangiana]
MKDKELVETVSCVCSSWRLVCWDILLWKSENTLDFTALKRSCRRDFCESYHSVATKLMSVLKSIAFEEDRLTSVTSMVFHWALPLSDKHLVYLAERSPRLQRLSLYCAKRITDRGFSRAIRNWKAIEEMSLGSLDPRYYDHIIREIGIHCKKLQVFCLCSLELNEYFAVLIAENLRYLKELGLQNVSISRASLHAILSKCSKLVTVSITDCGIAEPKNVEIRSTKAGYKIKWLIGTETEEVHSLNSMLDALW